MWEIWIIVEYHLSCDIILDKNTLEQSFLNMKHLIKTSKDTLQINLAVVAVQQGQITVLSSATPVGATGDQGVDVGFSRYL